MSIDVMKQALEALDSDNPDVQLRAATALRAAIEQAHDWDEVEALRASLREHMAEIHRLRAVIQKSVEPIAWVYPEALEAFKNGKPWTAYGENGDGPYPDGVKRIPLYLNNDAVARRVEPRESGSGAGFESLPASPNQPEQRQDTHEDWCASLTQLLMSMPPKPAPCNCKLKTARRDSRQWQGLTDEERGITAAETWGSVLIAPQSYQAFARAIEAKLREKNV